ncbi:DUF262 domain-containing protein [Luteolibacter sp. Populi]|uniref:DUF262 domain-containing protein n=1 Tax=Luteolibacter sp. Populi TaxID=3230487 RepID=UPI003465D9BD
MISDDDDFSTLPYGTEDESDFGSVSQSEISHVSVTGTDWTTETVLTQLKKGNIELNPKFQRRDAWESKRKSLFIESLILGLPVPPIVLAEHKHTRGKYIVLDGKQRLLCLRQFTAEANDKDYKSFRLSGLEIRPDLDRMTFEDIERDLHLRNELTAFENQPIRTVVVRGWRSEALLFHVFVRLNRGSKPLSPQELRQALHPGPFLDFADEAATTSHAIRDILKLKGPDFRMRDVELIVRFFSFQNRIQDYRGNLKNFLDESCKEFNDLWADTSQVFVSELSSFEEAHALTKITFGKDFNYGKWVGARFEKRFNRSVFDVMIRAFMDTEFRENIEFNGGLCVDAFKNLCSTDSFFVESIERTTKSLESTRYRFSAFYQALNSAYQTDVPPPVVGF